jgi:hypothetical protein
MRWQGGNSKGCLYENRLFYALGKWVDEMAMEEMTPDGPSLKWLINVKEL